MKWRNDFAITMIAVVGTAACSASDSAPSGADALEPATPNALQPPSPNALGPANTGELTRSYPYLGPDGETICSTKESIDQDGAVHTADEFYYFNRMNDVLDGRMDFDHGQLASIKTQGVTHVATCDDARRFTAIRTEYIETQPSPSAPSEPPAATAKNDALSADSDAPVDKIAFAGAFFEPYSVRLQIRGFGQTCSATLINSDTLLTSAHCVPGGDAQIFVDYGRDRPECISKYCGALYPPSWGGISTIQNAHTYRNPNYLGTGDTGSDLGIVKQFNWGWAAPADTSSAWMRIQTNFVLGNQSYWMNGYGFNGNDSTASEGIGRYSNSPMAPDSADSGAGYFYTKTKENLPRMCQDDDGGPAWAGDKVLGFASNFDASCDNGFFAHCPNVGCKYRYTTMGAKLSWVESIIGACYHSTTGSINYAKCWSGT